MKYPIRLNQSLVHFIFDENQKILIIVNKWKTLNKSAKWTKMIIKKPLQINVRFNYILIYIFLNRSLNYIKQIFCLLMKTQNLVLITLLLVLIHSQKEHSANERNFPVTWSSVWGEPGAVLYRLNSTNAWYAGTLDQNQWIQVTNNKVRQWIAVVTQGRYDYGVQWVTRFRVSYTLDGVRWRWVEGGREFIGNFDRNTQVINDFDKPVFAKTIRIHPTAWNSHMSLRFDAIFMSSHLRNN